MRRAEAEIIAEQAECTRRRAAVIADLTSVKREQARMAASIDVPRLQAEVEIEARTHDILLQEAATLERERDRALAQAGTADEKCRVAEAAPA